VQSGGDLKCGHCILLIEVGHRASMQLEAAKEKKADATKKAEAKK
jgi:hypothetical protein